MNGSPEPTTALLDHETLPRELVLALIERAHQGDQQARDRVVSTHLRLVWSLAGRFGNTAPRQELFQAGCIGILKAVDNFDTGRGSAFSTYAVPYIMGEMKSYLRGDSSLHVPRSTSRLAAKIKDLQGEFQAEHGRQPTLAEVAKALGVERDQVVEALESAQSPLSVDARASETEEDLTLLDQLGEMESGYDHVLLHQLLAELEPRLQFVIRARYFQDRTQRETGEALGVSQVQVSRLEKKALRRLRALYDS